eukprot:Rhum_TRINITY_DN14357_c12_g1::Rhum_TRINITY_DN14357_c12_g1_i2::g.84125::m.84125
MFALSGRTGGDDGSSGGGGNFRCAPQRSVVQGQLLEAMLAASQPQGSGEEEGATSTAAVAVTLPAVLKCIESPVLMFGSCGDDDEGGDDDDDDAILRILHRSEGGCLLEKRVAAAAAGGQEDEEGEDIHGHHHRRPRRRGVNFGSEACFAFLRGLRAVDGLMEGSRRDSLRGVVMGAAAAAALDGDPRRPRRSPVPCAASYVNARLREALATSATAAAATTPVRVHAAGWVPRSSPGSRVSPADLDATLAPPPRLSADVATVSGDADVAAPPPLPPTPPLLPASELPCVRSVLLRAFDEGAAGERQAQEREAAAAAAAGEVEVSRGVKVLWAGGGRMLGLGAGKREAALAAEERGARADAAAAAAAATHSSALEDSYAHFGRRRAALEAVQAATAGVGGGCGADDAFTAFDHLRNLFAVRRRGVPASLSDVRPSGEEQGGVAPRVFAPGGPLATHVAAVAGQWHPPALAASPLPRCEEDCDMLDLDGGGGAAIAAAPAAPAAEVQPSLPLTHTQMELAALTEPQQPHAAAAAAAPSQQQPLLRRRRVVARRPEGVELSVVEWELVRRGLEEGGVTVLLHADDKGWAEGISLAIAAAALAAGAEGEGGGRLCGVLWAVDEGEAPLVLPPLRRLLERRFRGVRCPNFPEPRVAVAAAAAAA